MTFAPARKTQAKLRLALIGPAGSGKTYTALNVAQHLGDRVALIDTEHGSASKYADLFSFDTAVLDNYDPRNYVKCIREAETAGYQVLIIDSLSHAWSGKGGALELVDKAATASRSGNKFTAWGQVTPLHIDLIETMLGSNLHLIVTMRSKMEYVLETDSRGKQVPRKVGLQPIQRDGMEYEFDVVADLDADNTLSVSKSRCPALHAGRFPRPGADFAAPLIEWLSDGVEVGSGSREAQTANDSPSDVEVVTPTSGGEPESPTPVPPTAPGTRVVEERANLMRRIHALANELGIDHDTLSTRAREKYGVESMSDLPPRELREIVASLKGKVEDRRAVNS
jgi:hypothetical protein